MCGTIQKAVTQRPQPLAYHVRTDLFAGTGGGGGFFAREGGARRGPLFLLVRRVASLPCEVAGDTD